MKQNKFYFFLFAFSISVLSVFSQEGSMYVPHPIKISPRNSEGGIFLGASYYTGDLNPSGHFNRFTRPAGGVLYRVNFNPRISAKATALLGSITADDAYSKNESHRNRNLSFKSRVLEFAVEGEFNFMPYATGNKKFAIMTPYIFAGVAVYHFEPLGYYQYRWYKLQPIGTEGQGSSFSNEKPYSLTQFSIPFGVGVKVNTARRVGINFEWGLRRTFTDYLDDVSGKYADSFLLMSEKGPIAVALADKSLTQPPGGNAGRQRGNSYTRDWYAFAGVMITFKFRDGEGECDAPH